MHRRELVHFSENNRFLRPVTRKYLNRAESRGQRASVTAIFVVSLLIGLHAHTAMASDAVGSTENINAMLDAAEAAERQAHLIYPSRGSAMSISTMCCLKIQTTSMPWPG